MSNKAPIFSVPASQHFSDIGFDPQIDYFQVLEEARRHKRETSARPSIDALHFIFQKPISKDDPTQSVLHKKKKRWWWKNAFLSLKRRRWPSSTAAAVFRLHHQSAGDMKLDDDEYRDVHRARAFWASGPVYATESRSGSSRLHRSMASRRPSGLLAGTLTPASKGEVAIPYLSLRELNMEEPQRSSTFSAKPIYLVT